jgi:hypothetical protein
MPYIRVIKNRAGLMWPNATEHAPIAPHFRPHNSAHQNCALSVIYNIQNDFSVLLYYQHYLTFLRTVTYIYSNTHMFKTPAFFKADIFRISEVSFIRIYCCHIFKVQSNMTSIDYPIFYMEDAYM